MSRRKNPNIRRRDLLLKCSECDGSGICSNERCQSCKGTGAVIMDARLYVPEGQDWHDVVSGKTEIPVMCNLCGGYGKSLMNLEDIDCADAECAPCPNCSGKGYTFQKIEKYTPTVDLKKLIQEFKSTKDSASDAFASQDACKAMHYVQKVSNTLRKNKWK